MPAIYRTLSINPLKKQRIAVMSTSLTKDKALSKIESCREIMNIGSSQKMSQQIELIAILLLNRKSKRVCLL